MSIAKRGSKYVVRWLEGDRHRSRSFDRKRDAELFDGDLRRKRQLGTLAQLDNGRETLDEYLQRVWIPTYATQLAPNTQALYAHVYDKHIAPQLGSTPLREITPERIARWQADTSRTTGPSAVHKAASLLASILQRAVEGERIPTNPARLVRKPKVPKRTEVRPLSPATVEAMRAVLGPRDAMLVSILAYAGLRPGEALSLRWRDVRDRTLLVYAPKTNTTRTVRLLAPLAHDLREWRMASGRPPERSPVIASRGGDVWSEEAYRSWRRHAFDRAVKAAGIERARPYDLRHSFASLLLHEGRSVIYVARQLGHDAALTLSTYGHVIDELEDAPRLEAERAIAQAREQVAHRLPRAG